MKREPLQIIEDSATFTVMVAKLELNPEQALRFAGFIERIAAEALVALTDDFISVIDKGVITLAEQHRDAATLATIRNIQAAAHQIYLLAGKKSNNPSIARG